MKTIAKDELPQQIDQLVSLVANGDVQVEVEDCGETVAVLISIDEFNRLRTYYDDVTEGEEILEAMRKPFQEMDPEQVEREVAAVIKEVRLEQSQNFDSAE